MKNIFKIILSLLLISLPLPIFSQSTKVYEYWLDKFLLPKLNDKFNNHKIIDEIDTHLKDKLGSVIKLKKILNENKQAEISVTDKYFSSILSYSTKPFNLPMLVNYLVNFFFC